MSIPVRFYYDLMSQPSRALYMFLRLNKIPFEDHPIALRKGIQNTEHFRTHINRLQKVPAIVDGQQTDTDREYKLSESIAIFRYLIGRDRQQTTGDSLVADHWYPADLRQRGAIDEYLEWQHINTREACSYYFILKYLKPRTTGREPGDDQIVGSALRQMEKTLDKLENLWLGDATDDAGFLAGQKEISIADLLAAAELEQPRVTGYEPGDGRPKVQAWLDRVRAQTNPHYADAHRELYKLFDQAQSPVNPAAAAFSL